MALTFTTAMWHAASAGREMSARDEAFLAAIARTVPEVRARSVTSLFAMARSRVAAGREAASADVSSLTAYRNNCFALARDVAFGIASSGASTMPRVLAELREWIGPSDDYAEAALVTFRAKHV